MCQYQQMLRVLRVCNSAACMCAGGAADHDAQDSNSEVRRDSSIRASAEGGAAYAAGGEGPLGQLAGAVRVGEKCAAGVCTMCYPNARLTRRSLFFVDATGKKAVIDEVQNAPVRPAGWVARLYSGQAEIELQGPEEERGVTRARGIQVRSTSAFNCIYCRVCSQKSKKSALAAHRMSCTPRILLHGFPITYVVTESVQPARGPQKYTRRPSHDQPSGYEQTSSTNPAHRSCFWRALRRRWRPCGTTSHRARCCRLMRRCSRWNETHSTK